MAPKKRGHVLILLHVALALQMRIHTYYWKDSTGSHKSMTDTSSCENALELWKTSLYPRLWKNEHLNHIFGAKSTQSKSGANPCSMWLLPMILLKQCCPLLYNNFFWMKKNQNMPVWLSKMVLAQHLPKC
jgi:hypothetical protein